MIKIRIWSLQSLSLRETITGKHDDWLYFQICVMIFFMIRFIDNQTFFDLALF